MSTDAAALFGLEKPARYYPFERGIYDVSPNLKPFGTPFGNGEADKRLFQMDLEFPRYRANKMSCRNERLAKYCQTAKFSAKSSQVVNRFLIETLTKEYPDLFKRDGPAVHCVLTGERLEFDAGFDLKKVTGGFDTEVPYAHAFDAICSQVQEDVAVMQLSNDGSDWLSALHVCSPSSWGAEEKIGKNFALVHAPVPGMERTVQAISAIKNAMVHKGPFVRFVWGLAADDRLNHHPQPPPGILRSTWTTDRSFSNEPPCIRVERQVIWGLPEINASLFTIRTFLIRGDEIRRDAARRERLRAALLSMSPEARAYKSIAICFDGIIGWLDGTSSALQ